MNLIPVNIVNVKSVIINHNAQRGRDTMKEDVTGKPEYSIPREAYVAARLRLRKLWDEHKGKPTSLGFMLSERNIARHYRISQPLINHLRNRQDMNIHHVRMFAEVFGVQPNSIFPELFEGVDIATPDEALNARFNRAFEKCPADVQRAILLLMQPYN